MSPTQFMLSRLLLSFYMNAFKAAPPTPNKATYLTSEKALASLFVASVPHRENRDPQK
jgi:hypothetical protein